jgi:hypothetical protein
MGAGVEFSPTEVLNQYSGNTDLQPWYLFDLNGINIRVGPRKRVYAIKVEVPNQREKIATKDIRKAAVADGVTYYANGSWQSRSRAARLIEIHAWGKDKLIEYLTIVGKQVLAAA